jgi:hypothetical protein
METNNINEGLLALPEPSSNKGKVDEKQIKQKADIIEALKLMPIVEYACKKAGLGRTNYYRFRKSDQVFAQAADESINEGTAFVNDMAESGLLQGIKKQEFPSIAFWLKHRHPKFASKLEINAKVEVSEGSLTPKDEELRRRALELAIKGVPDELSNNPRQRPSEIDRQDDQGLAISEESDE